MKGLIVALGFLTRLPMPRVTVSAEDFARSMRWFPAVGLVVGGLVATGAWLGALIDPWIAAWLGLLLWVGVTGALHLDGLADIADASGAAHKDRDRLLAVLADPHVGSFGVVTIGIQLLAKLILIHAIAGRGLLPVLIVIPCVARMGPLLWTRTMTPLHDGLAARFNGIVRPIDLALCFAALLVASWFVPGLLVAPAIMLLWAAWLERRIGGLSGDGHGAGIEVVESASMLAILAWAAVR
ncbi:adenosylcobinamide-GDP ribazoletransferase [Sphingomonas profundi]|uniref:adenosylcobinamide-GDP ribazoletransferase n=1 Tax=Alterirhizorhabdus profundi TaxID=2681549 RepID=UPI0012E8AC8B|nr:adenosylcobinamide-GDP ribazoletransferase [Sphingomonas profundi]